MKKWQFWLNGQKKVHEDDDWMDSDELKHKLISSSRTKKRLSKMLFVFMVVIAVGVMLFNLWTYCFDLF